MEAVRKPVFRIEYQGKDITKDITPSLMAVQYNDRSADKSDEVSFTIDDSSAVWRTVWYPVKGDAVVLEIGFDDALIVAGTFTVDQMEMSGPPDTFTIRALAAGINSPLRTKNSRAYEQQTLREIAERIAGEQGLTVEGEILNIRIGRVTQNRETDLGFLRRVAGEFGHLFSVRGDKLVFTSVYDIQNRQPVIEVNRADLLSYNVKDKATATYKAAVVKYHNPRENETIDADVPSDDIGVNLDYEPSIDTLELRCRAENKQQAEAKARAALHKANTRNQEGDIKVEGNPLLVAGNTFMLTGMGEMSGKWYILESVHSISFGGGYTTSLTINRTGNVDSADQKNQVYISSHNSGGRGLNAGRNIEPARRTGEAARAGQNL